MTVTFNKSLQDGNFTPSSGRIVIYKEFLEVSRGPSRDHNDILRSLASKYKLHKDSVISDAIRLYWDRKGEGIIVCPVRKLDEDMYYAHEEFYSKMILNAIR